MNALLITIRHQGRGAMGPGSGVFTKMTRLIAVLAVAAVGVALQPAQAAPANEEGIALAIIYDTSGSMREPVPAGGGVKLPKYVIANKALGAIVDRISRYATNAPANAPRKIEVGLYVFHDPTAIEAVPYGPFNPDAIKNWVRNFSHPNGATPLGNSIRVASKAVMASPLSHKHIVIITDGINTSGPKPESVIPGLKRLALHQGGDIFFHFVAFDVDAKVFDRVKGQGATVLAAANEQQLNSQLEFIFERKILLEDEEPRRSAAGQPK
jgi:von Willebrand factor type A domain